MFISNTCKCLHHNIIINLALKEHSKDIFNGEYLDNQNSYRKIGGTQSFLLDFLLDYAISRLKFCQ